MTCDIAVRVQYDGSEANGHMCAARQPRSDAYQIHIFESKNLLAPVSCVTCVGEKRAENKDEKFLQRHPDPLSSNHQSVFQDSSVR